MTETIEHKEAVMRIYSYTARNYQECEDVFDYFKGDNIISINFLNLSIPLDVMKYSLEILVDKLCSKTGISHDRCQYAIVYNKFDYNKALEYLTEDSE
jgi:hypothetical protein